MKPETLRNTIDAHGWLGLIISIPLFIIFWAGAITLFHPEVGHWAAMAHFPAPKAGQQQALTPLVKKHTESMNFDNSRRLFINLPSGHQPFINIYIPVLKPNQDNTHSAPERHYEALTIDPTTGQTLTDNSPFQLASFLNELHYTLKLPQGRYLVGMACFFFMVILFTGIVIQFKKLIRHFFLYRTQGSQRHQVNDLHNVIGVISLPYGLMYALTGLMFNLGIVFQIPTMMVLYQGDEAAMISDSGYTNSISDPANITHPMPDIDAIIQQVATDHKGTIHSVRLHNYNDKNATIQVFGLSDDGFANKINTNYHVYNKTYEPQDKNNFSDNVDRLLSLHMADFAGVDLRFLYFLLAMGVCAMIVAGNLLWIIKRQKRSHHPKILALTRALTLGGCMGVIVATAVAFMLERILPINLAARADYVTISFSLTLLVSIIIGFYYARPLKIIHQACLMCAGICLFIVVFDAVAIPTDLIQLWRAGYPQPFGVTFGLLISAFIFIFCAQKTKEHQPSTKQSRQLIGLQFKYSSIKKEESTNKGAQ